MGRTHKIHCTVENCHYWGQGNHCTAQEIMVTSDSMGNDLPDSFDAPQASTADTTPCSSCMETCCKTFVEKGSSAIESDGVFSE